jgi:hypothetical protein
MSEDIWRDDYREFVGFYWTLPMPAFGFRTKPHDWLPTRARSPACGVLAWKPDRRDRVL